MNCMPGAIQGWGASCTAAIKSCWVAKDLPSSNPRWAVSPPPSSQPPQPQAAGADLAGPWLQPNTAHKINFLIDRNFRKPITPYNKPYFTLGEILRFRQFSLSTGRWWSQDSEPPLTASSTNSGARDEIFLCVVSKVILSFMKSMCLSEKNMCSCIYQSKVSKDQPVDGKLPMTCGP